MFVIVYRAFVIFFFAISLVGCGFFDNEPLKIGFIGTLSGPQNFLGISARDGALLAIDEINRQGGINGRQVELIIRDDRHNQSSAHNAFTDLVKDDVSSVIGPMTSEMATGLVSLADKHQTVLISPTASTQDLVDKDDYFLRLYPTAAEGTIKIAHFAYNDRQLDSFTVVYDMTNSNFSLSWLENFKRDYVNLGGSLAAQIPFESQKNETSYQTLAKRIKDSGSKGLLILANPFSTAMICQNLEKTGADLETYATEWSYGPDLIEYGGRKINKLMLFKTYFKDSANPDVMAFRNKYQKQYSQNPWFISVHAYDATRLLLSALQKNDDKANLKETLLHYGAFKGVQTEFEFNAHGDIIRPHYITRLDQGAEQFVAKLFRQPDRSRFNL